MASPKQVYLITGGGTGFGALSARALAVAGHTVFAGILDREQKKEAHPHAEAAANFAAENKCDLRTVPLDLLDQPAIEAAVAHVLSSTNDKLDVVIHNAGHMNFGPAESFAAEQVLDLYNINVVGMHRLNTVVLPYFRSHRAGHIVYISSSSSYGGKPPYLGAYFAAKAAMDTLAQVYARELHPWGIETTIVVPGAFGGTDHFTTAMQPGRPAIAEEYNAESAPTHDLDKLSMDGLKRVLPQDPELADPKQVADKLVELSHIPRGQKPFRVFVDPTGDGGEEGAKLVDEHSDKIYKRMGIEKYLNVWL